MGKSATNRRRRWTWDDYRAWPDAERWEIIGGSAFAMSPAPGLRHQHILLRLAARFERFFRDKPCRVFPAPADVKLSAEDVVQPDLLVVCPPTRMLATHVEGPPTLVVEIASPASVSHDRLRKSQLYARYRVTEYWLVAPYPSLVEVLLLDGDSYRLKAVFGPRDTLRSPTFPGLAIRLAEVFDFPLEPGEPIAEVHEGVPPYPVPVTGR